MTRLLGSLGSGVLFRPACGPAGVVPAMADTVWCWLRPARYAGKDCVRGERRKRDVQGHWGNADLEGKQGWREREPGRRGVAH